MRKLTIFLAVALMATIGFSSCGDSKSLKGTSWKSDGEKEYVIFSFTSETECKSDYYWDGKIDDTSKGTYTYISPNVTIDLGFDATYTGTVDGKKMTLLHEDGFTIILTKQ